MGGTTLTSKNSQDAINETHVNINAKKLINANIQLALSRCYVRDGCREMIHTMKNNHNNEYKNHRKVQIPCSFYKYQKQRKKKLTDASPAVATRWKSSR